MPVVRRDGISLDESNKKNGDTPDYSLITNGKDGFFLEENSISNYGA